MDYQAERMKTIPMSQIRKIFEMANRLEAEGKRVIHLEIGRPDFDTPVHIKEAAKKALDEGKVMYTSNWGLPELRDAIADKMAREHNIKADPETEIIVTIGANEASFISMMGVLNPGDEVLLPDPAWPHYRYCIEMAGANPVFVPLREERAFELDPQDVQDRLTSRSRMLIVTTPHNPTGAVIGSDTLAELARIAIEHDLIVISDEIYEKMIYDGAQHTSLASLPGMWERTFTINGFSKAYAMTGWRLGYLVANQKLISAAKRVHQYTVTCANSFAQYGAVAALTGPQTSVEKMVAEFDRRRRLIVGGLESIGAFGCARPRGAFYLFPSVKALKLSSEAFVELLLTRAHVAAVPGSVLGVYGEGYIRFAYSTSYEDIEEGLDRIKRTVEQLN